MATFTTYDQNPDNLATALLGANSGIQLLGPVTVNASSVDAISYYDGSIQPLGIGSGLLITSGYAPGLLNDSTGDGQDNSGITGFDNGDTDINAVVNTVFQTQSYDATSLSFDFTATDPNATSISFDVVFGSEEYPEWVDAFVDCAVVIVNGVNYALFNHDPNAPLSVISPNLAAGYFQDNAGNQLSIQYDGVSQVLKIVAPINGNGAVNHIKIGIADTGDHILDSGLFISHLSAGNIPGSGVVSNGGGTANDDTLTGSVQSEYFDAQSGNDVVYAGGGDDIVVGGAGNDTEFGGSGDDDLEGDAGDDHLDGGSGTDTAVFAGLHSDYVLTYDASTGTTTVSSATDGADTLLNVEKIHFKDGLFALTNGQLTEIVPDTGNATNTPGSVGIIGAALAGQTLTAIVVDANGVDTANGVSYQWLTSSNGIDWTATADTGNTYTVPENGAGLQVQVQVSYTDQSGYAESQISSVLTVAQPSGTVQIDPMQLAAPAGASVMDPITTLVQQAMNFGFTANEAAAAVKSVLGIDAGINIATYDALAVLAQNPTDAQALAYAKLEVQVAVTASMSDPSGQNLALAVLNAHTQGVSMDLTNANDLGQAGLVIGSASMDLVQNLNQDMAAAGNLATIQLVWNDWAGQEDHLKPYLNHLDAISVHINQAPTGLATGELQTSGGQALTFTSADLVAGFTDPDGGALSAANVAADQGGTVTDNLDGTWTFTPAQGFFGPVELSYSITDGQGASVPSSLMLIVAGTPAPVNSAPELTGTPAALSGASEDTVFTVSATELLQGYTDTDGDALSVDGVSVSDGVITDNGDGTYTVTPSANFHGAVTLSYTVTDGMGGATAATLGYQVAAVNDAVTGNVTVSGAAQQGQTLSAAHTLQDADGLGTVTYQWLANGVALANATSSTYTLTAGDVGKTFSVVASFVDGDGTLESKTSAATASVMALVGVTLNGTSKADTLNGTAGNDTLNGAGGNDTLNGLAGNDVLTGGAGTDKMNGGADADLYLIAASGDHLAAEITDTGLSGTDEVRFTATKAATLTLYAGDTGIEQVSVAAGSVALNLNAAAVQNGLTLLGNAGINKLTGTNYADTLDGGAGSDTLVGGKGNDTYVVDLTTAGALQDTVTETGTDSGDTLLLRGTSTNTTAVALTLASALENLDASGTGSSLLNLTGNTAANVLTGNDAKNTLSGLDGNDTLFGGKGADTLDGGAGHDTFVYSNALQSDRANTDIVLNVDFGGLDAASAVDTFHFDGLVIAGVTVLDFVSTNAMNTLAALQNTLNADVMPENQAVLMHVTSGVAAGSTLLFVDANGQAGYQASGDYAIQLVGVANFAGFDLSDLQG